MEGFINEEVYVLQHDKGRHLDALPKEQQGLKSPLFRQEYTLAQDMTLQEPIQVQI